MAGMERFTQRARRVLSIAHQEAERLRQNTINTEHLLLGLAKEEGCCVSWGWIWSASARSSNG